MKPDTVVVCSRCGRKIIAQRWSETEEFLMVSSEYVGKQGECFRCSSPKKKEKTDLPQQWRFNF